MDSITIAALALGAATFTYGTSETLYKFISAARNDNRSVNNLQLQVSGVAGVLSAISEALDAPGVKSNDQEHSDLWIQASRSIQACQDTVQHLNSQLKPLARQGTSNPLKQASPDFRLGLKQDEIDTYMSTMRTHSVNLQLILGMVNLYAVSRSATHVSDAAIKLERLDEMMIAIDRALQTSNPNEPVPVNELSSIILDSNTQGLRRCADLILSSATSVMGHSISGRSGRIGFDSSEPVFNFLGIGNQESTRDGVARPVIEESTTGSEFGAHLDQTTRNQIQHWTRGVSFRTEIQEDSSETLPTADVSQLNIAMKTASPGLASELFETDNENEMELLVAQNLIEMANEKYASKDFSVAQQLFQSALVTAERLNDHQRKILNLRDIKLTQAFCFLRQGNWAASEPIFTRIISDPVHDKISLLQHLQGLHGLAELHLRKGSYEAAINHCRQALDGRQRARAIGKDHPDSHASLRLLAIILWANGDHDVAEAHARILPESQRLLDFDRILMVEYGLDMSTRVRPDRELAPTSQKSFKLLHTLVGHRYQVNTLAFSPNGQVLASGAREKTVRLWDTARGTVLHTLEGHFHPVATVAFSPNGQVLASGSEDKTVRLWDTSRGTLLHTLEGHSGWVHTVAFSPNGQVLASGSGENRIRLWDTARGTVLHTLEGHFHPVATVAFSPNGQVLASGSEDKTVRLWDTSRGTLLHTLEGHSGWVHTVAFSPNGQVLASGSEDKTVRLWDTARGTLLHTLEGHSGFVYTVAFSPNGQVLASGSEDKTVRLWDTAKWTVLHTLEGHSNWVCTVAFSPNGQVLASGSADETIRLWS